MNQVSGQQKARRRDSQGHSIREGPGLLRAHGAQHLRASAQDHSNKPMILLVGQYSTGKTTFIR